MPINLKTYYLKEINSHKDYFRKGELQNSWRALERSHVLGQAYPLEHSYSHWLMLKFGVRTRNLKEIIGQLPRLMVGGVKSFVGIIPVGNTGGANVPPLKAMPIDNELRVILNKTKV